MQAAPQRRRVLVLGLDGATWEVLRPLAESGRMPALARLREQGAWADLISTIPPVTGPAWVSIATGKNPGRTGVFDFVLKRPRSYGCRYVSSAVFRGQALWDLAGRQGRRSIVFNYPLLYPPYEINGVMVSGLLAPTDEEITYPQELRREIRRLAPGYRVHLSYHDPRYDDEELFLAELNQLFSDQVRVLRHLLAAPPRWDLGVAVISATDWLQHLMWKHMDDQHPLHDPEISPRLAAEVVRFWRRVDDLLDGLSHEPHTTLVVISDHGFGPHDQCLNLPRWLELKGYLRRRRRPALVEGKRALSGLARRFKALAPRGAAVAAKRALAARVTDEIDFGRSQAYVCGHTLPFGGIYLNIRGRDPQGILSPARAVEVKRRLLDELAGLGRELDQPLEVEAHEPPDIYHGEHTAEAPDIIFGVNDWRCVVEENRWAEDVFQNRPYTTRHTGSHRRRGIFLAAGPGIVRAGRVGPVGVCDVAPTVLSLLGLAPTPDMDGLARTEIMER